MLRRLTTIAGVLFLTALASAAMAQQATRPAPTRPPLFFSEMWKSLLTPPDDHNAWPAAQGGVSNPEFRISPAGL